MSAEDEGLPVATVWTRYEVDCPLCNETTDCRDIQPSGEFECEECGETLMIGETR